MAFLADGFCMANHILYKWTSDSFCSFVQHLCVRVVCLTTFLLGSADCRSSFKSHHAVPLHKAEGPSSLSVSNYLLLPFTRCQFSSPAVLPMTDALRFRCQAYKRSSEHCGCVMLTPHSQLWTGCHNVA
ncbi:uncharacterized [Tachysurus ichikawai]